MKILLVNDYGTRTGGAEVMLLALRAELRARGHDVRFFTTRAAPLAAEIESDEQCFGTTSRWRTLLQTANVSAARQLRRVLAQFGPDVVHVRLFLTQLSPLILPLLRDTPAILHIDSCRVVCPRGTKLLPSREPCHRPAGRVCLSEGCLPLRDWPPLMLQTALWRRFAGVFDRVVSPSEWLSRRVAEDGLEVSHVIWNGVRPCAPRPPLVGPPTVGFAARLVPEKGGDVLLRALPKVREEVADVRLILAGDGPERERLESLTKELGLGGVVTFLGRVPHEQMQGCLSAAWVQAVPSTWEEPFGIVAAEALMRGTAVVASNSGGLKELVRDGETGHLFKPGSSEALASALLPVLRDRQRAEQLGASARVFASSNLQLQTYVDRFVDLYREMCSSFR